MLAVIELDDVELEIGLEVCPDCGSVFCGGCEPEPEDPPWEN